MIAPVRSMTVNAEGLSLDDFVPDAPAARSREPASDIAAHDLIDGVAVTPLIVNSDARVAHRAAHGPAWTLRADRSCLSGDRVARLLPRVDLSSPPVRPSCDRQRALRGRPLRYPAGQSDQRPAQCLRSRGRTAGAAAHSALRQPPDPGLRSARSGQVPAERRRSADSVPFPMTGGPGFSIVLATYGRGRHIAPTIASVLGQTIADFELIVVGDGCSDDTQAAVADDDQFEVRDR